MALLVCSGAQAGWPEVLQSVGWTEPPVKILTGDSHEARALGIVPEAGSLTVRSVTDSFQPNLQLVWERAVTMPRFRVPANATVFTRDKWTGAPLVAGIGNGPDAVLWTAIDPGERGSERFPYLLQALVALGAKPPYEARDLWAFFDSSYRLRADPDFLAKRWRSGGIAAIHIAAWHYWEPDPERDAWLRRLLETCHRHAILVYAWIELPHVSERFWQEHPEWREKTATGQDAQLDWRKLMHLGEPDCAAAVATGLDSLADRFDWDGINLGELYFESLEGYLNPARFTPFHPSARKAFRASAGFDPAELYDPGSPRFHAKDAAPMRKFLEYRAQLSRQWQEAWLARLQKIQKRQPQLDLVLTHIDDRFDTTMRDKLGADAARLMPAAERAGATFLIEDPATVWHLGPERYAEIAKRYAPLTQRSDLLAIDLNIVERYQDVYPAKQQTGVELFQLVRRASASFPRVALYFENSILPPDWDLLSAAAAAPRADRNLWPRSATGRLKDFNGLLLGAEETGEGLKLRYRSRARAIAVVRGTPDRIVMLPPGEREALIPER